MKLVNINQNTKDLIQQAASMLNEEFQDVSPTSWPTFEIALQEVQECITEDRICRGTVDDNGKLIGWIGAIPHYHGNAWELHPIVVKSEFRYKGIGSKLISDLEEQVRNRGGITIWLGTDDETGQTTLSNKDIYPNLYDEIKKIENLANHPYEFYIKNGYNF